MNTSFQFGWSQLLLLLIAGFGLAMIISAGTGRKRYRTVEVYDETTGKYYLRRRRHTGSLLGRILWGRGISGAMLVLVGVSLLWLTFTIQSYLGLTGKIQVAQVHATTTNVPHMMSVELKLFDNNGNPTSDKTYLVSGDEWIVQGNIIQFPTWMNILGFHASYKLTRLEGRFDDVNMERNSQHTVIELNGGDDNFFKTVQQQAWTSPFVKAAYGNAVFLQPDGKTYDVLVSQTGLEADPAK